MVGAVPESLGQNSSCQLLGEKGVRIGLGEGEQRLGCRV
jgi:hypothetical protein